MELGLEDNADLSFRDRYRINLPKLGLAVGGDLLETFSRRFLGTESSLGLLHETWQVMLNSSVTTSEYCSSAV